MRKLSFFIRFAVLSAAVMIASGSKAQSEIATGNADIASARRFYANPSEMLKQATTNATSPEEVMNALNAKLKNIAKTSDSTSSDTAIVGLLASSEELETGFYTIPTQEDEDFDLIATMSIATIYGLVEADGIIYFNYYLDSQPVVFYIDTETWTALGYDYSDTSLFALDMTHDPVTGNIYGIFWNDSANGYVFGTADYDSLSRTAICDLDTSFMGIAADTDGTIYGLDYYGNLYIFDKETGEQTLVGDTGIGTIYFYGSLVVNPSDGALLWSHVSLTSATSQLYEIDKTNATATVRIDFSSLEIILGMYATTLTSGNAIFSNYDFVVDGIYYHIISTDDKTVSVTYESTAYNTYSDDITIPSTVTYEGVTYTVTAIGANAFRNSVNLTAVTIPESVTTIGKQAFAKCISLTTADMAEGLTVVGDSAFYFCSALTSLTIPSSVSTIGASAFYGCSALTTVTSLNETPPTWTSVDKAFSHITYSSAYLYVPLNTYNTYRATEPWSNFDVVGEITTGYNTYPIGTTTEWNYYADRFASYNSTDVFTLTADLDFTEESPTPFKVFYGEFDGGGHTITICDTITTGDNGSLFYKIDTTAVVHDFVIEGSLYTTASYTAPVCYCLNGTLKNVVNNANVTATTSYNAGIVASVYGGTLINCGNNGAITNENISTTTGYIAGVAAYATSNYTFDSCYNTGAITGAVGSAGILSVSSLSGQFSNCYNNGNVIGTYYLGGILAYQGLTPGYRITFYRCHNNGDVTSLISYVMSSSARDGSLGFAGGISGYTRSMTYYTECYNTGNITVSHYAGGIAAWGYQYTNELTDCFNTGNITTTDSSYGYTGGIIGQTGKSTLTNCYNSGTISGKKQVGGIIGDVHTSYVQHFSNLYSSGTVAKGSYSGNIFGCSSSLSTASSTWSVTMENLYALDNYQGGTSTLDNDSVTIVTRAELAALDLGDGWTAGDDYTYPRLTSLADNDYAMAYAAQVFPAEGDSETCITKSFYVGAPNGLTWTDSEGLTKVVGNNVYFTNNYTGTLTMTATAGDASVDTEIECAVESVVPIVLSATGDIVEAGSAGALTVEISDGTPPFDVVWTNGKHEEIGTATMTSIGTFNMKYYTPTECDLYYVTVSDAAYLDASDTCRIIVTGDAVTATFENLWLDEESFWTGPDTKGEVADYYGATQWNGSFPSGSYSFSNSYVPDWASWTGFAYSNSTDSDFVDYTTDQYNAATGGGYDGSENFAVAYGEGTITILNADEGDTIDGFYITNNTYTTNAVTNGDDYATAFDEGDYLRVVFTGTTAEGETSTVTYYLADYTSANAADRYCLDTWQWVDLRSLGNVTTISYAFEGTDATNGYLNTPTYFCLDNFNGERVITTVGTQSIVGGSDIDLSQFFTFDSDEATVTYALPDGLDDTATEVVTLGDGVLTVSDVTTAFTVLVSATQCGKIQFVEIPFDVVTDLNAVSTSSESVEEVARFTIDGRLISSPQRGVNIVRTADGKTHKVVVK